MITVDIISTVVNKVTGKKSDTVSGKSTSDLSAYLLKSIWDSVWEIKKDSNGSEYIFGKLPVVTQYGITMYAGDNVEVTGIYEGLPIDNSTIKWVNGVLTAVSTSEGSGLDESELAEYLTNNDYAKKSDITTALSGYATSTELAAVNSRINNFLEGSDTDGIINKWLELESFLSGLSQTDNLATILSNKIDRTEAEGLFVTIDTTQTVTGEKDFTGGLKVNGGTIYYDSDNKYWKLEGDLIVSGGVTMYASDTAFTPSTIMDALAVDGENLKVVDGILTFVGETGGTSYSSLGSLLNVDTSIDDTATVDRVLYQAAGSGTWTSKPLSEIGGGTADSVAWDSITGKPTFATVATSGNYNDLTNKPTIPTKLSQLTDDVVSGKYLPLTGGTLTLDDLGGFNVYRNNAIYSAVHFYATINGSKTDVGYLGFKGLTPVYIETTGVTHELLHSSNYSSYALPISGGTLTGTLATPDFLFKSDQYGAIIKGLSNTGIRMYYNKADSTYDILEFNSSSGLTFNGNAVWHSGNDGSDSGLDADLLDGCHAYYFYNIFTESISSDALSTFTKRNIGNIKVANSGYSAMLLNFPMFGVGSVSSLELYIPHYDFDTYGLLARISVDSNRYTSWRTFAFTDSNVASATKLQTARTIWGQSFDGTGNVDGTLTLTATSSTLSMYGINVRTNTTGVFGYLNTISSLESNMDTTTRHHNNLLLGKNTTTLNSGYIGFYYQGGADSTSNCMSIGLNGVDNILNVLGTGNVGIGTTTPTYTLHVNGETLVTGHVTTYGSIYMNNSTIFNAKNSSGVQESWLWPRWSDNNTYLNFGSGGYFYIRNRDSGRCLTLDKSGNGLFYGGVTMYSDIRKKTKLQDVELSLKQIANAPLIEHYYNSDEKKTTHVGSIAQYWAGLNDWFCRKDSEGYYTMEIQNAALASAISVARELVKYESKTDKKIRMLKKRISQLEDEIESLKKGA